MKLITDDKKNRVFISLLLIIVFAGCNTGSPTTAAPVDIDIEPSATVEPSPSPSSTPTQPTLTETAPPPTTTKTPTRTATSTPTPTSEPPTLVVNEDTVCRTGPGLIYDIRTYVSEGATPVLLGYAQEKDWWSVEEHEFNALCWVSASVVTVDGDIDSLPEFTPEPTPTIEPTPTAEQKGVIFYVVALNTGGSLGCGDSLIPVYTGVSTSGDLEKDIHNSLHALLKLKVKDFNGYYNPLHNAHLNTGDVKFNDSNGIATVRLNGSIPKPKDECEYHRVRGVLWETVRHYRDVSGVTFWIGDKLIGDLIAVIDR